MENPSAPVGYTINYASGGFDSQKGYKRRDWRLGLFECWKVRDCGVNCCCAHFCCGSRIWYQALRATGMDEKLIRKVAMEQEKARRLRNKSSGGKNPFAEALAVDPAVESEWSGAKLREELGRILFGKNNQISPTQDLLAHTACLWCGRCQEVDAVMTYSYEVYGQGIYYGNWNSCECAELRGSEYQVVRTIPYQTSSNSPENSARPLLPGKMERS
jgi:hypothetical protein